MIKENEPLSKHTTYKIGGVAKYFCQPKTIEEVQKALRIAKEKNLNVKVIGRGSNLLFSDQGFDGLIVKLDKLRSTTIEQNNDDVYVTCLAGAYLPKVSANLLSQKIVGFEWANSIPGTIGGGVYMNAGINSVNGDTQMSEVFVKGVFLNKDLEMIELTNQDLQFSYRKSILQTNRDIICCLSATLKLRYASEIELSKIIEKVEMSKQHRLATQPLNFPSCGSVFRNPKPLFAGQLIEELGLKGYKIGGAIISPKHANWIVNEHNAKASDVLTIIEKIKNDVKEKFGIDLKVEVEIVK